MQWACNDKLLGSTEEWDVGRETKGEARGKLICVRVARLITLSLLTLRQLNYLLSDIVAPPTQGTWRSNDYVNALRLVDAWLFFYGVGGGAVYIHIGWSTQTCATTLAITIPLSQIQHHISQHHIYLHRDRHRTFHQNFAIVNYSNRQLVPRVVPPCPIQRLLAQCHLSKPSNNPDGGESKLLLGNDRKGGRRNF